MNLLTYYSFGTVGPWMYNYSLGIQHHPDLLAFKKFNLLPQPDPDGTMKWARGHYVSIDAPINGEKMKMDENTKQRYHQILMQYSYYL